MPSTPSRLAPREAPPTPESPRPSVPHWLRVFSEVRRDEAVTALMMLATLFLLMAGYYVLKTVREPLILMSGTGRLSGAELRSYTGAAQAIVLLGLVPLYGRVAARVSALRLVLGVTAFFVVNIQLFALWAYSGLPGIGIAFYIWLGIFNLAVIAQFWSFANDLYRMESGTRLFPFIAIGAAAGSPVGSWITGWLIRDGVDIHLLMQVTAATLVCCGLLLYGVHVRESKRRRRAPPTQRPLAPRGGFRLIFQSRYLLLMLGVVILLSVATRNGEYMLSRIVLETAQTRVAEELAPRIGATASVPSGDGVRADRIAAGAAPSGHVEELAAAVAIVERATTEAAEATLRTERRERVGRFIGGFYGEFYTWVNLLTLLVQALIVSRLVRWGGIGAVVLLLPVIAFGVYTVFALGVGLALVRWAKTAEKVVDYSVMNTARALMWLPTSREEKYNAKLAMDTFFVRFGALLTALCVFVLADLLGFSVPAFAVFNLVLVAGWMAFAIALVREHRRISALADQNGEGEDAPDPPGGDRAGGQRRAPSSDREASESTEPGRA